MCTCQASVPSKGLCSAGRMRQEARRVWKDVLAGRQCLVGLSYSGFQRKEGFVIKTCTAVLFINQKTGNSPNRPPLGRAWQICGGRDGDTGPRDTWGGRAPWKQEPCVWGEPNIMQFAHSTVITGHCRHAHPYRCQATARQQTARVTRVLV